MPITLPSRYQNAPTRRADVTRDMLDIYNIVLQINNGVSPQSVQSVIPTTGQSIQMTDDATSGLIWLNPAGTLASLTLVFPTDANSDIGQIRRIATSKIITSVTLSGATILNPTTTLNANDCFGFQKVSAGTWVLLQ